MEETKNIKNEPQGEAEKPKEEQKPKKGKKESEADKLKAELEKSKEQLLRTAAEFDNYKKRTDRERAGIAEYAKCEVIKKLLPILDNIDRAAAADNNS
ncbi:MAG: nucleotide exchange factor GrpE, partial [Clostridia bacterium]|nr:nucleotide exchange factor GrpE [Clostridia bacterium]